MDKDHIKIIFLGESGVGKTCLYKRFDSGLMGNGYYCKSHSHPRPIVILASQKFDARLTIFILAVKKFLLKNVFEII